MSWIRNPVYMGTTTDGNSNLVVQCYGVGGDLHLDGVGCGDKNRLKETGSCINSLPLLKHNTKWNREKQVIEHLAWHIEDFNDNGRFDEMYHLQSELYTMIIEHYINAIPFVRWIYRKLSNKIWYKYCERDW